MKQILLMLLCVVGRLNASDIFYVQPRNAKEYEQWKKDLKIAIEKSYNDTGYFPPIVDQELTREWRAVYDELRDMLYNNIDSVIPLLNPQAVINVRASFGEFQTPLWLAVTQNKKNIAEILLKHGASPTALGGLPHGVEGELENPMMAAQRIAKETGDNSMVTLLMKYVPQQRAQS